MPNQKFICQGKYTKFFKVDIYSNTSCNNGCGCYVKGIGESWISTRFQVRFILLFAECETHCLVGKNRH